MVAAITQLDLDAVAQMPHHEMLELLEKAVEHRRFNKLAFFTPYPKQVEFIRMGAVRKQRLLTAGNRQGKSEVGAYETACHLTGLYPANWEGYRFPRPVSAWCAGESTTVTRNVAQTKLCGPFGVDADFGTGYIPKYCFVDKPTLARGAVADAYDTIQVQHHNADGIPDGISKLQFKSYEQGRKKFQGDELDFIWWDEEPPEDVYTEGEARWSSKPDGRSFMTFTPLEGMSNVVLKFLGAESANSEFRGAVRMGFKDCPHMTEAMVKEQLEKYPAHEHDARMNGVPLLGSGRIFTTDDAKITFPVAQMIPEHWPVIWGVDFGISHPFAATLAAWDRDMDVIYLIASYKAADALPIVHAEAIRRIAADVPVAWPHDGARREAGSGDSLAKVYKALGLKMLETHAQFAAGGYSTEAAVLEMQQRFADGRLRVREDLADFFDEYRMYHRKDGLIVKVHDDLISATMKVIMMKRRARTVELGWQAREIRKRGSRPRGRGITNPWTGRAVPASA